MSTHIKDNAYFAKTVLMPGDPLRAKYIAENFLTDYKEVTSVRGIYGYTGKTKEGKEISVMASGMGIPSIGIYSYELYTCYGVENIIRIGTCGSYQEECRVGDVILADTAEDYTVGKACEIVSCKVKILSGLHTIPCRPTQNFAKGYLGYYLNSAEYHDKLIPLITGIKVSAISKKEIKKTIIKYPIYKEQEKIANLLLLIDNKLNANIKKLELFETYQKGLLQQLFI